eukprot:1161512-Pelagomonas_calceolata.AAC.14
MGGLRASLQDLGPLAKWASSKGFGKWGVARALPLSSRTGSSGHVWTCKIFLTGRDAEATSFKNHWFAA